MSINILFEQCSFFLVSISSIQFSQEFIQKCRILGIIPVFIFFYLIHRSTIHIVISHIFFMNTFFAISLYRVSTLVFVTGNNILKLYFFIREFFSCFFFRPDFLIYSDNNFMRCFIILQHSTILVTILI